MLLPALLFLTTLLPTPVQDNYTLGPDSQRRPGVPTGRVEKFTITSSKIYPGTVRDAWLYIPAQYDASKPACLMVFNDGGGYVADNGGLRATVVMDNLIHQKEMPVTIGLFLNPGVLPPIGGNALPRYNRTYEYDQPDNRYVRFLLEEVLPDIEKRFSITQDPSGRAITGLSSGGICAFIAAWERPDKFGRVLSFIGSYVNLRGGHLYPTLIRKMEPKPIRIFLQDGSNDQDIYAGHWFIANNDMAAAFNFAGYDHKYVVGDGGHNGRHAGALMPDAMRWLWKDYPAPIRKPINTRQPVMEVLKPGEEWEKVSDGHLSAGCLATAPDGTVYFSDRAAHRIYRIAPDGRKSLFVSDAGADALAVGPDGRLYACETLRNRIAAYSADGKPKVIAAKVSTKSLAINRSGDIYFADRGGGMWRLKPGGKPERVNDPSHGGVPQITALQFTPDQSLLLAMHEQPGKFGYSWQLNTKGALTCLQPYFDVHVPYGEERSGAAGMAVDTAGRLYLASTAGVQIFDQAGRVIGIIQNPELGGTTSVAFGGADRTTLFAATPTGVYRRRVKVQGALSCMEPIKPAPPRL